MTLDQSAAVIGLEPPTEGAAPIVWAVWLGCDTASKLASQWGISINTASNHLAKAARDGLLWRVGKVSSGSKGGRPYIVYQAIGHLPSFPSGFDRKKEILPWPHRRKTA